MRLFVALALPDDVAKALMLLQGGVPGARWQCREQLHMTLRFIGEVDGSQARAIDDALCSIEAPPFDLALNGVGQFGNRQPHSLWAGVRPNPALDYLQRKVDAQIRRIAIRAGSTERPGQKFTPHVSLARLRNPELEKVRAWLTHHALAATNSFAVDVFCLYSSMLTSDGSVYRLEEEYPLRRHNVETSD